MTFLQVHSIGHTYFSKQSANQAIQNISFSVEEGEFISFLGPSGCGKTTVLSILAGLIHPTEGTVTLNNQLIQGPNPKVGYMLQQDYLFPWKTVKENIEIGLKMRGRIVESDRMESFALLKEVGLAQVYHQYPAELSGGMRQRVAFVRTLATDPDMLLLDEPFSALDYQTKLKLEILVAKVLHDRKKTALLVTHDIGEAIAMSDRIMIFSKKPGQIDCTFTVPDSLRKLNPFEARQHVDYSIMFQQIWKELERIEQIPTNKNT